jgi:hypothetical protein
MTLRGFLRLIEDLGGGELRASELAEAIAKDGEGLEDVLRAEGIVRAAGLAKTRPCEIVGCARHVRKLPPVGGSKRSRLLAVCSRDPAECEIEDVSEGDLAQVTVVLESLLDAVRRALGIERSRAARSGPRALSAVGEPVLLGEQIDGGAARDVFFVRRPGAPELRVLVAERANVPRATLVLVPTAGALAPEIAARAAVSGKVVVEALADVLLVEKGRIAAAMRLRALPRVAAANATLPESAPGPAHPAERPRAAGVLGELLPQAKRWNEVTFFNVDEPDKIGVEIARRSAILTAADLGLAEKRARRKPTHVFDLLTTICDGNGEFVTKRFGSSAYGKRLVSDLRIALSAAFGIEDDAFHKYSFRSKRWRPKFRALAVRAEPAPGDLG